MEDCQTFWHLWRRTLKTAMRKLHSSEITVAAKQSPQLNPTEPKQLAIQTAKQQAAKCYFTQQQDNHVVPLSIRAHSAVPATYFHWISCSQEHAEMSMQTFLQAGGLHTTAEISCPFLNELLHHKHPGHLTCMLTLLDCQQSKAGGAVNPKCTTRSSLHLFSALSLSLQCQTHP